MSRRGESQPNFGVQTNRIDTFGGNMSQPTPGIFPGTQRPSYHGMMPSGNPNFAFPGAQPAGIPVQARFDYSAPTAPPRYPGGNMPPQQPGEPYQGGGNHDNEPPKKKSHKLAIALGGVSAAAVIGIGGSIFGLSGGSDDEHHAPGVNNSSSENSVIFGEECESRSDIYGAKGLISISGEDWDTYSSSQVMPPLDVILKHLDMADTNKAHSGTYDVDIDPNTLTDRQKSQLYDSAKLYAANRRDVNSVSTLSRAVSGSIVHLYGDYTGESSQSDGKIDSPDLNLCVSFE